jgi:DNA (cytosine-5)-methyltransferase 1
MPIPKEIRRKPRALDLFCGAGGATAGLQRAGYHVSGVDLHAQPNYCGDAFFQSDAMEFCLHGYDLVWASPPCQLYSACASTQRNLGRVYPDLVGLVRERLQSQPAPWVIENVLSAPLIAPAIVLCGLSFGLPLIRHRAFESSVALIAPAHETHARGMGIRGDIYTVVGRSRSQINRLRSSVPYHTASVAQAKLAMGIDWMSYREMTQAVPPAYAEFIARQIGGC